MPRVRCVNLGLRVFCALARNSLLFVYYFHVLTVSVYDRFRNRWQQNPTGPNLSSTGNNLANLQNNNRIDYRSH